MTGAVRSPVFMRLALTLTAILAADIAAFAQVAPRDRPRPALRTGTSVLRGRVVAADGGRPLRRVQLRITAPELGQAGVDLEHVVVVDGAQIPRAGVDHGQAQALRLQLAIGHPALAQEVRAADLEPGEVLGVVGDAHLVRLRVAHADRGRGAGLVLGSTVDDVLVSVSV